VTDRVKTCLCGNHSWVSSFDSPWPASKLVSGLVCERCGLPDACATWEQLSQVDKVIADARVALMLADIGKTSEPRHVRVLLTKLDALQAECDQSRARAERLADAVISLASWAEKTAYRWPQDAVVNEFAKRAANAAALAKDD
jgi:hypothetical protein